MHRLDEEKEKLENNWNLETEWNVRRLGEQAQYCNSAHITAQHHYEDQLRYMIYVLNIVSFSSAILSVIDSFYASTQLTIAIKVLAIITATMVKYHTSSKDKEVAELHKRLAAEYFEIFDLVQSTLSRARVHRPDALKFEPDVRKRFLTLYQNISIIPQSVIDSVNDKSRNSDISRPIIAGELSKIIVSNSDRNNKWTVSLPKPRVTFRTTGTKNRIRTSTFGGIDISPSGTSADTSSSDSAHMQFTPGISSNITSRGSQQLNMIKFQNPTLGDALEMSDNVILRQKTRSQVRDDVENPALSDLGGGI